jgi:hypothetical protein
MSDGLFSSDWQIRGETLTSLRPSDISNLEWTHLLQDKNVFVRRSAILKKLKTEEGLSLEDWKNIFSEPQSDFSIQILPHFELSKLNCRFLDEVVDRNVEFLNGGVLNPLLLKFIRTFFDAHEPDSHDLPKLISHHLFTLSLNGSRQLLLDEILPLYDFIPTKDEELLLAPHLRHREIPVYFLKKWAMDRLRQEADLLKSDVKDSSKTRHAL